MNCKRLTSLTRCLFLAIAAGTGVFVLADIASAADPEAQRHFNKANELRKVANHDAAIAEYNKVINLSPNSMIAQNAQYWIGQLYFKMGRLNPALTAFEKIIEEYPKSAIISSTKLMVEITRARLYILRYLRLFIASTTWPFWC